jgi:hypothetical protein
MSSYKHTDSAFASVSSPHLQNTAPSEPAYRGCPQVFYTAQVIHPVRVHRYLTGKLMRYGVNALTYRRLGV